MDRCSWCNMKNTLYVRYHDEEWGQPRFDDAYLFEMLLLESFQAGLSWECVLNKRENFRIAFDGFDAGRIAAYGDEKCRDLALDKGIIRNRRKISSAVKNAGIFLDICKEYGSFESYLRVFWDGNTVYETGETRSPLSDAVSGDLVRRGMKFMGTTIVYSYLQAIGVINSHDEQCFLHRVGRNKMHSE